MTAMAGSMAIAPEQVKRLSLHVKAEGGNSPQNKTNV